MTLKINPDKAFIKEVMASGGDSVKKCFQCANCTAVCDLSSGDAPFPRKQMQMAGWGMKDALAGDPSVWYCHQCKDCATHCPRNAKPADAIAAIRLALIKHFSFPKFMGVMMNDPKFWPAVFLAPMGLILLMLTLSGSVAFPEGHVHFGAWMKHIVLEVIFSAAVFLGIGGAIVGGIRFWKAIDKANPGDRSKGVSWIKAIINTFVELLTHKKFGKCGTNKSFKLFHMLIFFGFAGLFIVTGFVVIFVKLNFEYPFGITHPLKILGNIAGIALIVGVLGAMANRLNASDTEGKGTYQDWLLLITILGVGVTGMFTQVFRFMDIAALAYPTYFIHMVFNAVLLVFLPYSKFAHIFYRFIALVHARMTGRILGDEQPVYQAPAPVPEAKEEKTTETEAATEAAS